MENNNSQLISYSTLRRWIGILGILLPFAVAIGGKIFARWPLQPSISAYYYTNMRDFFVGLLCLVGAFLVTYDAFDWIDHALTDLSGAFAIGVASFPMDGKDDPVGLFQLSPAASGRVHYTCATLLFVSLAIISLFLFTRSDQPRPGPQKRKRNAVYRGCGIVMVLALLAVPVFKLSEALRRAYPGYLLYVEGVCLVAFGFSWLVKGDTLFQDVGEPETTAVSLTSP